jgi:hypothetical protein
MSASLLYPHTNHGYKACRIYNIQRGGEYTWGNDVEEKVYPKTPHKTQSLFTLQLVGVYSMYVLEKRQYGWVGIVAVGWTQTHMEVEEQNRNLGRYKYTPLKEDVTNHSEGKYQRRL